jgi:hypothetical protein
MIAESWRAVGNDRKECGGTGETGSPLTNVPYLRHSLCSFINERHTYHLMWTGSSPTKRWFHSLNLGLIGIVNIQREIDSTVAIHSSHPPRDL